MNELTEFQILHIQVLKKCDIDCYRITWELGSPIFTGWKMGNIVIKILL